MQIENKVNQNQEFRNWLKSLDKKTRKAIRFEIYESCLKDKKKPRYDFNNWVFNGVRIPYAAKKEIFRIAQKYDTNIKEFNQLFPNEANRQS